MLFGCTPLVKKSQIYFRGGWWVACAPAVRVTVEDSAGKNKKTKIEQLTEHAKQSFEVLCAWQTRGQPSFLEWILQENVIKWYFYNVYMTKGKRMQEKNIVQYIKVKKPIKNLSLSSYFRGVLSVELWIEHW